MKAKRNLEREITRKNCEGNPCERELEYERSNVKRLEYQLDAEKEKVKFYKRELERDRYLSSRYLTSSSDPHKKHYQIIHFLALKMYLRRQLRLQVL
ncbi:cowpox A-type inclusion protein [Variola virus]|uniref:Cowpox A-type inclusion protein n=1 Tax=Variola virus TaxID=10255 RepID=Q0NA81_VARV|nr:cowpox A-type inclusion protein [Variola virus]ABF27520.1 cowpox A-type inclusion protein [Variola virus]ABG45326.1 cowpox A-type inclusion protein [Variola virus]